MAFFRLSRGGWGPEVAQGQEHTLPPQVLRCASFFLGHHHHLLGKRSPSASSLFFSRLCFHRLFCYHLFHSLAFPISFLSLFLSPPPAVFSSSSSDMAVIETQNGQRPHLPSWMGNMRLRVQSRSPQLPQHLAAWLALGISSPHADLTISLISLVSVPYPMTLTRC